MLDWLTRVLGRSRKGSASPPPVPQGPAMVTLGWLLGLSGNLADGSNESVRFRENIESRNIHLGELRKWCAEALESPPDPQRLFALQDLVNSLGGRLDFDVEYGAYEAENATWMPFDGLWRVREDLYLAVEVFSVRLERLDLRRIERDLATLAQNPAVRRATTVACLVLCGGADPSLQDQIRLSSLHDRIRLLPLDTLFELLRMDLEGVLDRRQLPILLRPFSPVGVDTLLGFLDRFLEAFGAPGEAPAPAVHPPNPDSGRLRELETIARSYHTADRRLAKERLKTFLSDHPDDPAGWELAGDWATDEGDPETAARAYRAALVRDPQSATAASRLSQLLRGRGEHEAALEVLEKVGGLSARLPVLLERATLLLDMNQGPAAVEAAQAAHAAGGGSGALRLLVRARELAGDRSGLLAALRQLSELEPGETALRERISALEAELQPLAKTAT